MQHQMGDDEALPRSEDDRLIERGQTYDRRHTRSEVTGIWRGVQEVDEARNTKEKDVIIIIQYSCKGEDGERVDDLTDTLPEFLESTD